MSSTPAFDLHLEFDDVDALGEAIPRWDVEFRQLTRGSFRGRISQICGDGWVAGKARIFQSTEQVGLSPLGLRTIVIGGMAAGSMQWRGQEISGGDLAIFPKNGELHAVGDREFNILTLTFSEEALRLEAIRAGFVNPGDLLGTEEALRIAPREMAALRRVLHKVSGQTSRAEEDHPLLPNPLRVLAATLAGVCDPKRQRTQSRRDQALTEAVRLLGADRQGVMSIKDLSEHLQVSARTLDAAFLDTFGVTPAAYRKALRLNVVHRMLHRADPATTRVRDVARSLGFVHISQFTADYRAHFGVLPSQSLHGEVGELKNR